MKDTDDSLHSNIEHQEETVNEDNPEWDGSESELVADDDAEEYEIPETGIKLSYVLTEEEMYNCLYNSSFYKTKGSRAFGAALLFVLAGIAFFVSYFVGNSNFRRPDLFFGIFCFLMTALVLIVPNIHMKNEAKRAANGKKINAEIYPDHIDIGEGEGAWSIELDGNCILKEFDNIFMICLADGRNFAIPERVIEPEVYNEVKAIIVSGTKPVE